MAKQQVTIHDIARYLNVSASTVSRALANHPRISKHTRENVLRAADELNYKPNRLAANLRKGTGNTIGVIIPLINRHFFANIIYGIERIANQHDYAVIICQSGETLSKEIDNLHALIKNRVSGVLVSVSAETKNGKHFKALAESNIPLVMFDRVLENMQVSKVINNNFSGGYDATMHLIDQGYRKICHLAGPLHIFTYQERLAGYRKALKDAGIKYRPELVFENVISREKGYETARQVLDQQIDIDAVFAASDFSALGYLLYLKEQKINIPAKTGIVGSVNEPFSEFIDPQLSSIEQFGERMGETAAQVLLKQIEDEEVSAPVIHQITPKLIMRNSSQKLR